MVVEMWHLLSFAAILSPHIPVVGGIEQEQQTFPIGTCEYYNNPLGQTVWDGPTCHRLCDHYNLTTGQEGTHRDRELNCTYDGPTRTHACEGAKYVSISECQHSNPAQGPYDRFQCICGDDETIVCDSDYHTDFARDNVAFAWRRPPLECESLNVTDLESCIDVATFGGTDWYCNMSSTPCILKYERVGDYMMCTRKWRQGNPTVICGDACAWTSGGSYFASLGYGALGVAVLVVSIGTIVLL